MNYEKFVDMLEEFGKLGRIGQETLEDYLRESGRAGNTWVEEAFLQLHEAAITLGFVDTI